MGNVHRLDEGLIAKIAAGEVIERPYSVIKELVENSIDAGARSVTIEVEEGGRRRITVIDDGSGMTFDDARLSLERHATSKIASNEDLFRIQTLGFRGEALPSIAAVSFMTLETRADEVGVRIEIEGGKIVKQGTSSIPKGTRITVSNLFFNTPARLKFLKSRETEFFHSASWVETIALARPDIGFLLSHNGKIELRSTVGQDPRQRIGAVLGADVAEFMRPVSGKRGPLAVTGFVSDHRASSTAAKSLFFFVNGRPVRDRTLQHAVLAAYENFLMKHRYPWVALSLEIPPDLVDVNVHPTKSEVKFANGSLVHELVREAVREALGGAPARREVVSDFRAASAGPSPSQLELRSEDSRRFPASEEIAAAKENETTSLLALSIIGQAHGTYLLCETDDKLVLIDQHAAHERIGFEKLKGQLEAGGIERQHLLIPQNFDLRPSQGEVLKKYLHDLERVGLEIEFFGGNTFILRSFPTLLEGADKIALIEELIESLASVEKLTPLEERLHEVLERMACHRQVRAGDRLANEEIASLIDQLEKNRTPLQCPHGRPSVLEVPFSEIEKWFKRRL